MNKIYLPLLTAVAFFFVSCGEDSSAKVEPEKKKVHFVTESEPINNTDNEEDLVTPDEFSNAFTKKVYDDNEKKQKDFVEDKNQFFKEGSLVQNKFTNQEFIKNKVESSTVAGQIKNSKKYSWLPNWDFSGTGGVRLPDATISSDKSLLVIIDNVSSQKGKYSSLIVALNTFNFNIEAIHYYKGKLLTGIKFLPSSSKVVFWEEKQDEQGKGCFHLADLKDGRISASSELIKSSKADFEISNDAKTLIVKISKSNKLFVFQTDNLSEMPKFIECDQKEGIVAVSGDNKFFALAGKEKIEIFKFSDKMKLKEINTGLESVPDDFIFLNDNSFAMLSYMKPLYLVTDESVPKKLCEFSGRKIFLREDNQSLVFEESKNKTVSIIDLKTLRNVDSFSPEKLRPKTYGSALLLTYLPHLGQYMVLDRKGNLSLSYHPGRRWRKTIIFSPEK